MNPDPGSRTRLDRRESLRLLGRCGSLAALTGLAITLGRRSLRQPCQSARPCRACPSFPGCDLPKAKSAQQSAAQPAYAPHHADD
jgi:hypothetical protein